MSASEADETELESHIKMPNGGVAPRCQRVKKNNVQCAKPARKGYRTCPSHGAGYSSREASGERKKPGRPIQHGVYSVTPTRSYAETMEEVASLEDILTSSDCDLIALKAALVTRLAQLEALAPEVQAFEDSLEAYVSEVADLDDSPMTPAEGMALASRFAGWLGPLMALDRSASRVTDGATKAINAHKTRAETSAKLAETEGLAVFMQLNSVQRAIFHGLTRDEGLIDAYESALQRELYGPNRLELPPVNPNVLTYPVEKL